MPLAHITVVYGYNLTEGSVLSRELLHHFKSSKSLSDFFGSYVDELYSGNDVEPKFIGVQIISKREGNHFPLEEFQNLATPEVIAKFWRKHNELPQEIKDLIDGLLKPELWVIWSG